MGRQLCKLCWPSVKAKFCRCKVSKVLWRSDLHALANRQKLQTETIQRDVIFKDILNQPQENPFTFWFFSCRKSVDGAIFISPSALVVPVQERCVWVKCEQRLKAPENKELKRTPHTSTVRWIWCLSIFYGAERCQIEETRSFFLAVLCLETRRSGLKAWNNSLGSSHLISAL